MRERERVTDERSDGFLVLAGGTGTLEELFEIWTARSWHLHTEPVVVYDPSGHYRGQWAVLEHWIAAGLVRAQAWATPATTIDLDRAIDLVTPDPAASRTT